MDTIPIQIDRDPKNEDLTFLEDRLYEYNSAAVGKDDGNLFVLAVRNDQGEIVAGLHGWTWAQACEIRTLWVHAALRGQGVGAALLQAAEVEARAKGCKVIFLTTYSFQAPDFYQKYGFSVIARMEDFPPGSQYYFLEKRLV
jgi:N-acetylglutamate synthase-like GNAT family acetyltransferase